MISQWSFNDHFQFSIFNFLTLRKLSNIFWLWKFSDFIFDFDFQWSFNDYSMITQWSFNDYSIIIQWSFSLFNFQFSIENFQTFFHFWFSSSMIIQSMIIQWLLNDYSMIIQSSLSIFNFQFLENVLISFLIFIFNDHSINDHSMIIQWLLNDHFDFEIFQSVSHLENFPTFLDPPPEGAGGSYVTSSVCQSVCPSATQVLILPTIRFFWFFASS